MSVDPILAAIAARAPKLRTGVDIGFDDAAVSARFRERFPALWMTISDGTACALPYEGNQFDVAVLSDTALSQAMIREIHRVLRPAGMLFFSVEEAVRHGTDSTLSRIYNDFLRCGYDIVSVSRSPWWRFGRGGKPLTVCAQKKNWRARRS